MCYVLRVLVNPQSDQFQSIVGSMAALCNGAGRLFWGNMLDMFGFKSMFSALAAIQVGDVLFVGYTAGCTAEVRSRIRTGICSWKIKP